MQHQEYIFKEMNCPLKLISCLSRGCMKSTRDNLRGGFRVIDNLCLSFLQLVSGRNPINPEI